MNPIAWLLRRQGGVKAILWVGALVGLSHYWIFPLAFRFVSPTLSWGWVSPLNLALAVLSGALFAWAASRYFVAARRTGELELLLTTPLGATQIVTTQWAVLKRGLRWPLVLMIVPAILQTAVVLRYMGGASGPAHPYGLHYAVSGLISCVNIVFGAWALCWLGMWFGLRSGRQGQAIAWTVTLAKGFPYLIGILSWALFAALANLPVRTRSSPYWIMTWLPQVLDLLVYLALIRFARRRLQGGLAAPELVNFDLRASTLAMARDTGSAWRKVRHWTPS